MNDDDDEDCKELIISSPMVPAKWIDAPFDLSDRSIKVSRRSSSASSSICTIDRPSSSLDEEEVDDDDDEDESVDDEELLLLRSAWPVSLEPEDEDGNRSS